MAKFLISAQAKEDLDEIWHFIAKDNVAAANRVEDEIISCFYKLAENPNWGNVRDDLTSRNVRFWPVYSYKIVYKSDVAPIEIVRILSDYRDITKILQK